MQNIIIIIYTSQEPMFALMIMRKEQWETSTDNTHFSQAHTWPSLNIKKEGRIIWIAIELYQILIFLVLSPSGPNSDNMNEHLYLKLELDKDKLFLWLQLGSSWINCN